MQSTAAAAAAARVMELIRTHVLSTFAAELRTVCTSCSIYSSCGGLTFLRSLAVDHITVTS